jgi:hypothetical protein
MHERRYRIINIAFDMAQPRFEPLYGHLAAMHSRGKATGFAGGGVGGVVVVVVVVLVVLVVVVVGGLVGAWWGGVVYASHMVGMGARRRVGVYASHMVP